MPRKRVDAAALEAAHIAGRADVEHQRLRSDLGRLRAALDRWLESDGERNDRERADADRELEDFLGGALVEVESARRRGEPARLAQILWRRVLEWERAHRDAGGDTRETLRGATLRRLIEAGCSRRDAVRLVDQVGEHVRGDRELGDRGGRAAANRAKAMTAERSPARQAAVRADASRRLLTEVTRLVGEHTPSRQRRA